MPFYYSVTVKRSSIEDVIKTFFDGEVAEKYCLNTLIEEVFHYKGNSEKQDLKELLERFSDEIMITSEGPSKIYQFKQLTITLTTKPIL